MQDMAIQILLLILAAFALSCSSPAEPEPVRSPINSNHPPPNPIPTVGANVEEEDDVYEFVIYPIEPGGTWVFRDFLVGDPYRNSLLLFGDCENRKLELTVI